MSFAPAYTAVGARSQSAGTTTISPALPTTNGRAGVLVCLVQSKNNGTHACATTGWSKLGQTNSGASFTMSVFTAREDAPAPTITWAGSVAAAAQIAYYSNVDFAVDLTLGNSSASSGTSATHTSTSVNTSRRNSRVLYLDCAAANTAMAEPSGWTENQDGGSGTDAGRTVFGSKLMGASGSASGAISVTGANAAWVQYQLELRQGASLRRGPQFVAAGTRAQSAGAATLTPALPTNLPGQKGLLVCVVTSKNNATHSTVTSGWTKLGQQNSGANFTASIFTAPEGSAAPVITWTGSVACSAQVAYYADPNNNMDATLGASSVSSGATATHTSTAVTSTRRNSRVIYVDVAAANTALATPSGWVEDVDAGSATDAGRTTFGGELLPEAGTTGPISVTGANAAWVQWQIVLQGAAIPAALDMSKMEAGAWLEPPLDSLAAAKIELGAWLEPPLDSLAAAKIEIGIWLIPAAPYVPHYRRRGISAELVNGEGGDRLLARKRVAPSAPARRRPQHFVVT